MESHTDSANSQSTVTHDIYQLLHIPHGVVPPDDEQ